jgi:hypothetical protein
MKTIYRFQFQRHVPLEKAEATLMLALIAAEALHGQPNVRLSVGYLFGEEKHACVIDGDNEIARQVVLIFTQFLIHEFGEDTFRVRQELHEVQAAQPRSPEPGKCTGNGACGDKGGCKSCEGACACGKAVQE